MAKNAVLLEFADLLPECLRLGEHGFGVVRVETEMRLGVERDDVSVLVPGSEPVLVVVVLDLEVLPGVLVLGHGRVPEPLGDVCLDACTERLPLSYVRGHLVGMEAEEGLRVEGDRPPIELLASVVGLTRA